MIHIVFSERSLTNTSLGTIINNNIIDINEGLLINAGIINNYNASILRISNSGTFNNTGILDLKAGSGYNFTGGTLNNNSGGTLIYRRDFTFNGTTNTGGTVNLNAGGTLENYANLAVAAGYTQANSGTLSNNAGGTITNAGTFTNGGTINNVVGSTITNNAGGTLNNGGTFSNNGTFSNSGTFNNSGVLDLKAGSGYNFTGGTLNNNSGGTLIYRRDFTFNGAGDTGGTVNLNAGGTLENYANLAVAAGYTQANSGTFNNNTGGILTNAGTFTNSGTFNNNAGSTITNNAGGTLNNGGTFSNNGTFNNNGTFTNNGTVKGAGTIVGNVSNSGILAPGNSIGTMTITGNYTHSAGATYQVEVNAAGQSDKLVVTGTATLNGGTVSVLAESGTYNAHTTYNILTAGSIVGTFAAVTSNLAFLTPSLSYDPTNVYLLLTRNSTGFADVVVTPNQRSVASALDHITSTATGDMENIINNLLGLSGQGARSAYDQMGGLSHASLMEAASFSANRYISVLSGRMGGFSSGGAAISDAGNILLAFNENTGSDAGNMLLAAITSARENGGTRENGMDALPRGLWAKGYGSIGERRGDEISTKYDYRGGGLIVGFDRKLSERLLLGAAAGYSYTKVNMNSLNDNSRVASYQGSLYGAYNIDPWYVNGLIAYGYNRYDTTRNIIFGGIARTAHADYGGHSLSGYAETGYQIKTNAVDIIPMASIQAGSLWRNAFTESDAGALDLNADSDRSSSFIGSLGVKLRKEYKTKIGSLTPEIRARWLHEFVNSDYTLNASFAYTPASTFSVRGDSASRDSAALGAGLNWEIDRNFGFAFTYDATLSGDRTEHGGTAGIRYRW